MFCPSHFLARRGEGPFLLWVHLSSMAHCWDAPYAFRERYVEPGDPAPPRSAEVPRLVLPDDFDPDTLLGITQSYAAQVSLLDVCLGALVESLDDNPVGKDTLLAVLSARGFPLGEHGHVGACDEALHGELVHVPMMIRFPDEARRGRAKPGARRRRPICGPRSPSGGRWTTRRARRSARVCCPSFGTRSKPFATGSCWAVPTRKRPFGRRPGICGCWKRLDSMPSRTIVGK